MTDTSTTATNLLVDNEERSFTFDYSFWSFDGFGTKEDGYCYPLSDGKGYKDQKYVFDNIGVSVLDNAFKGYHTCLFAYG
jgi:hypothetical protein